MTKSPHIIDVSLPIYQGMITYPNNPPYQVKPLKTPTTFISEITMSSHTGTHIDVPAHVDKDGLSVDKIDLNQLIGPCRVLDMTHCKESIKIQDLEKEDIKEGERILVKTKNSQRGFKEFYKRSLKGNFQDELSRFPYENYIYLDGAAAQFLAQKRIMLFGIDSLSIKQKGSSDNRPHTELLNNKIVIIEGLDLSKVTAGEYNLFCLPLNLVGLDGAPARVILAT